MNICVEGVNKVKKKGREENSAGGPKTFLFSDISFTPYLNRVLTRTAEHSLTDKTAQKKGGETIKKQKKKEREITDLQKDFH